MAGVFLIVPSWLLPCSHHSPSLQVCCCCRCCSLHDQAEGLRKMGAHMEQGEMRGHRAMELDWKSLGVCTTDLMPTFTSVNRQFIQPACPYLFVANWRASTISVLLHVSTRFRVPLCGFVRLCVPLCRCCASPSLRSWMLAAASPFLRASPHHSGTLQMQRFAIRTMSICHLKHHPEQT